MRLNRRTVAASAVLLLAAQGAHAEDMRSELQEMREMVRALEDRVQAQEKQIEVQTDALEDAGIAGRNDSLSALSSFLESTDFYGSVSATYVQDLTFTDDNDGRIKGSFPYKRYDTFSLNQLWFGMDKAPTEESRGGFHVDIDFGANANGSTDKPEVYAAYASYLAPIGNGVQIDAGELWTLIGAEVVDTTGNFNISRGLVWSIQPVNHVGVIASTEVTDGVSFALGAVNDPFSDANFDTNNGKAVTGQIAWSGDSMYAGVSGIYGTQQGGGEGDKYGLIDVLLTADPSDNLSIWFNYDYNWYKDTPAAFGFKREGDDSSVHAFALAARLGITETTGVAVRGEILAYDLDSRSDQEQWSATGTIDHSFTDNVMARLEVRYDGSSDDIFLAQDRDTVDYQVTGTAELVYTF